jgi:hypothetical protein
MFVRRAFLSAVCCFLIAWIGTGACGEGATLSLCDAIKTALENDPEMSAIGSALAARKDDIEMAGSSLLPRLTLERKSAKNK